MMCARTCDARGPTPNTLYGSSSAATKTGGEMNTNTASVSSFHIFSIEADHMLVCQFLLHFLLFRDVTKKMKRTVSSAYLRKAVKRYGI